MNLKLGSLYAINKFCFRDLFRPATGAELNDFSTPVSSCRHGFKDYSVSWCEFKSFLSLLNTFALILDKKNIYYVL